MSTIYTLNSKVLKNIANDKWLIKKAVPTDEVTIGTQTWKNKNLAIDDGQGGITSVNIGVLNGYDYGTQYFYTVPAAERIAATLGNGWRLATYYDWANLCTYVRNDGKTVMDLRTTTGYPEGYNGSDYYGFGLLMPGMSDGRSVGTKGYYWTSTIEQEQYNRYMQLYYNTTPTTFNYGYTTGTRQLYSIRLVKD